jgi:hypothetical protein
MAEPVERPRLPIWVSVLALGLVALILWWIISSIVRSIGWILHTLLVAAVVGGILYLVLLATGRARWRGRGRQADK